MCVITEKSESSAIKDLQKRFVVLELLAEANITGAFDDPTRSAIDAFAKSHNLENKGVVTEELWEKLVNETYALGDRTLYLRVPNFRGADCRTLQKILGTLGFSVGEEDGIFGVLTEAALRRYQQNMGLPSDGIVGAYTYQSLHMLEHAWSGKEAHKGQRTLGLARVAEVLEHNAVCIFGKSPFTRSIASRMSNLALATTYASKIVSAENLRVVPDSNMILLEIAMTNEIDEQDIEDADIMYSDNKQLNIDIQNGIVEALQKVPHRMRVLIKDKSWEQAKEERSAQHYAINLLDALCSSLEK